MKRLPLLFAQVLVELHLAGYSCDGDKIQAAGAKDIRRYYSG